jgi:hypothetical protein
MTVGSAWSIRRTALRLYSGFASGLGRQHRVPGTAVAAPADPVQRRASDWPYRAIT